MKKKFTTSEFAKLHNLNKRTLHYYDNIGLFSPDIKGENNYRYYSFEQNIKLDYILMLKKIGMSIDEIKKFLETPSSSKFLDMANEKIPKLENEIKKLENIKAFLQYKKDALIFCNTIKENSIQILDVDEEYLLVTKIENYDDSLETMYFNLKEQLSSNQSILGYGSYIDITKIQNKNFNYDGLFAYSKKYEHTDNLLVKPKGTYLCAYFKGSWDDLPLFYNDILEFAKNNNLILSGYAYETSLNDFVFSPKNEYITKINIKVANR